MNQIRNLAEAIPPIQGSIMVAVGLYGFINPLKSAKFFGLTQATAQTTTYWSAISARNITSGALIITLSQLKEYRSLGIFLLLLAPVGLVDANLVFKYEGFVGAIKHLIPTLSLVGCGTGLLGYW